jgi:hypothetical protein
MYLPAYRLIQQSLRSQDDQATVTIPRDIFRRLLALMARASGFDDDWYSVAYDDVASALQTGAIKSALDHYSNGGYFEGRRPKVFEVDEEWYLQRYPDVAKCVDAGLIASAHAHYNQTGYFEGRVPNAEREHEVEEWNRVIERHAATICQVSPPHAVLPRRIRA